MVTKDVSVGAVEALASVFDAVFQVPYLEYPCRKMTTKKQQNYYGHWIERSFTKWNVLALSMYSKVSTNVCAKTGPVLGLLGPVHGC